VALQTRVLLGECVHQSWVGAWLDGCRAADHKMPLEAPFVSFGVFNRQNDFRVDRQVSSLPTVGIGAEQDLVALSDDPYDLSQAVGWVVASSSKTASISAWFSSALPSAVV
jgi:hypothetical protein